MTATLKTPALDQRPLQRFEILPRGVDPRGPGNLTNTGSFLHLSNSIASATNTTSTFSAHEPASQQPDNAVETVPGFREIPLGLLGSGFCTGAALLAAAELGDRIAAVVSWGGRPDLAGSSALRQIKAHSLLLVGRHDADVLAANERALTALGSRAELSLVPEGGHLLVEREAVDIVTSAAAEWFDRWFKEALE